MPSARALQHPPPSWFAWALLAALVLHAAAFLFVRFPADRGREAGGPLVLMPPVTGVETPAANRGLASPAEPASAEGTRAAPGEVARRDVEETPIPVIRESRAAAGGTTIPSTALTELRAAPLPLVVSPDGRIGRRRLERTPEQIAIARAESLLVARMAGIAVAEKRDVGAVGLAKGGITLAIPWQGFLPADRRDEVWREKRCSEDEDGESDKAGEGEARRAQCN